MMLQVENERDAEFLKFQTKQAELNRQHELKMLEVIMKVTNFPKEKKDEEHPQEKSMQSINQSINGHFARNSLSVAIQYMDTSLLSHIALGNIHMPGATTILIFWTYCRQSKQSINLVLVPLEYYTTFHPEHVDVIFCCCELT